MYKRQLFECADLTRPAMSAGVVICKHKFPIQLAMDLARQLLREAKRRCRELPAQLPDPGAIDFAVVKESKIQSLAAMREQHYQTGPLVLTERPYLVSGDGAGDFALSQLMEAARELETAQDDAGVPRSKWKQLDRILRIEDANLRKHEYDEFVAGLSSGQKGVWGKACGKLGLLEDSHWRNVDGGQRTGLLDLIEVLDILQKGR